MTWFQSNPSFESVLLLVLSLSGGCATPGRVVAPVRSNSRENQAKPSQVELAHLVVTPTSADNISEICDRGMQRLQLGEPAAAEQDLALCARVDPKGPHAVSALYHHAIALDQLGRLDAALQRFTEVAERLGEDQLGQAARLRALRLACHLERWELARSLAQRLLKQAQRLRPSDRVILRGALALEAVFRGDDIRAELHVGHARNDIESQGLDAPGKIHRDVAVVYFALGEIRRLRTERIALVSPRFAEVLEQRCELILAAQSAYSDAMRAFDAHWSTMAGYRIGELYGKLHQDLMRVPAPPGAKDEGQRQLFEGAMRLRYSVLVQKALNMMEHTVAMAERNGEKSEWVARAKAAQSDLAQRLVDEQAAINRLPYSRQVLEDALHDLENAGKGK